MCWWLLTVPGEDSSASTRASAGASALLHPGSSDGKGSVPPPPSVAVWPINALRLLPGHDNTPCLAPCLLSRGASAQGVKDDSELLHLDGSSVSEHTWCPPPNHAYRVWVAAGGWVHPSTACCCTEHTPKHPASRQLSSSQQSSQSPHIQNATCKQTRRRQCVRVHGYASPMQAAHRRVRRRVLRKSAARQGPQCQQSSSSLSW